MSRVFDEWFFNADPEELSDYYERQYDFEYPHKRQNVPRPGTQPGDSKSNDNRKIYTKVKGVTFDNRQNLISRLKPNQSLKLIREKDNAFDEYAVAVYSNEGQIGYVPKEISKNVAIYLDKELVVSCRVIAITGLENMSFGVNIVINCGDSIEEFKPIVDESPTDAVSVSSNVSCTCVLKNNGKVDLYGKTYDGLISLDSWENIINISTGRLIVAGLQADGRVCIAGYISQNPRGFMSKHFMSSNQYDPCNWSNITDIACGGEFVVGLSNSGNVLISLRDHSTQRKIASWRNICRIDASEYYIIGLKSDGTVVAEATFSSPFGRDVVGWKNMIDVAVNENCAIALSKDGVLHFSDHRYNNSPMKTLIFKDAIKLASFGRDNKCIVAVLHKSGDVTASSRNELIDTKGLKDIVNISSSYSEISCLHSDGNLSYISEYGSIGRFNKKSLISRYESKGCR